MSNAIQNSHQVAGRITIAALSDGIASSIDKSILNVSVSYTMSEASMLSFDVLESVDTNYASVGRDSNFYSTLQFADNNYFQIGRDVIYETTTIGSIDSSVEESGFKLVKQDQLFEIANTTISQGPGGSPQWSIKCYTKAVQQMKRDRKAGAIKGTGSEFVKRAAIKYGLKFWGEETSKSQQITQASGDKVADSLWDVIQKLADDAKFVCYETDGYLIFAREKYILHKWGVDEDTIMVKTKKKPIKEVSKTRRWVPLQYPRVFKGEPGRFYALQYPSITVSDNDPFAGDGTIIVDRTNGTQLRPGMTAFIGDIAGFNGFYLITSVDFNDRSLDPVSVSFKKPEKTDAEKKNQQPLPIGETYAATSLTQIPKIGNAPLAELRESAKKGNTPVPEQFSSLIFPLPNTENPYKYPRNDQTVDPSLVTGNIDVYERPIVVAEIDGESVNKTTYSITILQKQDLTINFNNKTATDTCVLITPIWTINGTPSDISTFFISSYSVESGVARINLTGTMQSTIYGIEVGDYITVKIKTARGFITENGKNKFVVSAKSSTYIEFLTNMDDVEQTNAIGLVAAEGPAIRKYLSDGLFLAKSTASLSVFNKYADLVHIQQEQILRKRFPNIDPSNNEMYPSHLGNVLFQVTI